MKSQSYAQAACAWALALLRGEKATALRNELDRFSGAMPTIAARFALRTDEQHLLELCFAVESSLEVAKAARALCGATSGGLRLEVARELLGAEVDVLLGWNGALRRHALVVADGDGALHGSSELHLGPGMGARLVGASANPESFAPGIRWFANESSTTAANVSTRCVQIARDEAVVSEPGAIAISNCGRRDGVMIGQALARRTGRTAIVVDGEVLGALSTVARPTMILALRREADLDGAIVVFLDVVRLAEWTLALGPARADAPQPPLIVATDAGPVREPTWPDGLRVQNISFTAAPPSEANRPGREEGYDQIRQMAIRDAERALGVVRRDVRPPIPPPPVSVRPAPPSAAPEVQVPVTEPAPAISDDAEAPKPKRRSRKAIEHFGQISDEKSANASPTPPISIENEAAQASSEPSAPFVDLPDDATPEQIARVASTSPNAEQRVQLIQRLNGVKTAAVVASLRANARSEHPAVREAAEAAMAAMFGPNWNQARAVPKPVQPPRSDDKDRGPPGGW